MKENKAEDIYTAIYDIVRQVPPGRVTTYGAIAAAIGMRSGARLVGYAMNNCHSQFPPVPAHRVVNRVGLLTGKHHFPHPDAMAGLLKEEGVAVEGDTVLDFESRFWDPAVEIGL